MTDIRLWQIADNTIRPLALAQLGSLDAVTQQLPAGLYTTFRTFEHGRKVLGLRGHLRRLYGPASRQGIRPAVEEKPLRRLMAELFSDLSGEARVRLVLTFQGEMYLAVEPFSPLPAEVYLKGVHVITVTLHRRRPELKATGFIAASQQARLKVQESGAFEALMVSRGRILEGLTSNFFYVRQGRLGTARRGILPGVTRRIVLRLARARGIEVCNCPLAITDLSDISEAFLTSSSRGVVPIVQIDRSRVGEGCVGNLTRRLMDSYNEYVARHAEPIWP